MIGVAPDGTEAQGRILIPEVAHDTDIDDYVVIGICLWLIMGILHRVTDMRFCFCCQFEISVTDDSNAKHAIKEVVRKELAAKLRQKLATFAGDLIKGKC